jgi:hypothetical protein
MRVALMCALRPPQHGSAGTLTDRALRAVHQPKDFQYEPHPFNKWVPMECTVPVIFAIDPLDFAAQLAKGFYDFPSEHLLTAQVVGSYGKTSVAWILREIFSLAKLKPAMASSLEWSLDLNASPRNRQVALINSDGMARCSVQRFRCLHAGPHACSAFCMRIVVPLHIAAALFRRMPDTLHVLTAPARQTRCHEPRMQCVPAHATRYAHASGLAAFDMPRRSAGDVWQGTEADSTMNREHAAPYVVSPYEGRYEVPCTTPDHITVRSDGLPHDRGLHLCRPQAAACVPSSGFQVHSALHSRD